MAHILVYLQRTPMGMHPASAVALCVARDLGSERGATVTGVCAGDAGPLDRAMVSSAARYGADVVVFCGPGGLERLQERLRPVHVLTPFTSEGLAAVQGLPNGPLVPRWVDARRPAWGAPDAVTGIVAGVLPWHDLDESLEAEYQGDVERVPMPDWVHDVKVPVGPGGTEPLEIEPVELVFVAPEGIDADLRTKLSALTARPATQDDVVASTSGTALWLEPGAGPLPDTLAQRGPAARVVLMPGPDGTFDASWALADWVLAGPWPRVLSDLSGAAWRRALM